MDGGSATRDRVRIGVVGAGRWGINLIRSFHGIEGCELSAVCDVDPARLVDPAIPISAERCRDVSALLSDPKLSALVIATPATEHAAQAIAALEAGKHVFVEKPMALLLSDAHRMREAARLARRCLMVGHLMRYHPAVAELRRLVAAGVLGEVSRVLALRLGASSPPNAEGAWWSLAPHDTSLIRYALGTEVLDVRARQRDFQCGGSEVTAELRLASASGKLIVSSARRHKVRRFFIAGARGTAMFDDSGPRPVLAVSAEPCSSMDTAHSEGALPEWVGGRTARNIWIPAYSAPFESRPMTPLEREAAHFIAAVRDGAPVATDADEGCRVTAVLEAGAQSISAGGSWISVPSFRGGTVQGACSTGAAEAAIAR